MSCSETQLPKNQGEGDNTDTNGNNDGYEAQ